MLSYVLNYFTVAEGATWKKSDFLLSWSKWDPHKIGCKSSSFAFTHKITQSRKIFLARRVNKLAARWCHVFWHRLKDQYKTGIIRSQLKTIAKISSHESANENRDPHSRCRSYKDKGAASSSRNLFAKPFSSSLYAPTVSATKQPTTQTRSLRGVNKFLSSPAHTLKSLVSVDCAPTGRTSSGNCFNWSVRWV